jgi:hypothetical protein
MHLMGGLMPQIGLWGGKSN